MKCIALRSAAAAGTLVTALALSLPPARVLIEQSMLWHVAVQMPLLLLAGALLQGLADGGALSRRFEAWNRYGLTGFIAAQGVLAWWMLPLAVDRAVVLPSADAAKLLSLLACGALLAHSFRRSPRTLQLFAVGYGSTMLVSAGLYMAGTDRRLCNAYALDTQLAAGRGLVALGVGLGLWWLGSIAVETWRATRPPGRCGHDGPGKRSALDRVKAWGSDANQAP